MDLQQPLREYIINQFLKGQEPQGFHDDYDLVEHGILDSLELLSLVVHLENNYQVDFGDHDFVPENFSSVNALAEFVRRKRAASAHQ